MDAPSFPSSPASPAPEQTALVLSAEPGADGTPRMDTRRRVRRAGAVVVVAGLVAGGLGIAALRAGVGSDDLAGSVATADPAALGSGTVDDAAVVGPPVLSVSAEGGFVAPAALFNRLPKVFVSADGRFVTPGPQILIYPGPALPNLRQRQVTDAGIATLRELAEAAGLDRRPPDYGQPGVADMPTTVVTYRDAAGRTFVHRVDALESDLG